MSSQGVRRLAMAFAAAASLGLATSAAAQTYDGDWQGVLKTPGGPLRLVLHLQSQGKETLAKLDVPDQQTSMASGAVKYEDGRINILFLDAMAELKGSLAPDGKTMNARWAQGIEIPFTMIKVDAPAAAKP